ncbi:12160_t:CDS:1 [Dentiscutata heterogama]|uniref:12160_t:CDS:1 n=1 Tax=Dentiscutata heterogama TaxID=1316150 RepID=A0ACA9JWT7_9GLOM|nr:12160_t:CDS:1 [Dentiscutata heterogama]
MNQSANQNIVAHPQNYSGQLQRLQNIGGPQNINGQLRRNLNISMHPLRHQNAASLFTGTLIAIQRYTDLINGADPFTTIQGIENPSPQSTQFLTLFSGVSFP